MKTSTKSLLIIQLCGCALLFPAPATQGSLVANGNFNPTAGPATGNITPTGPTAISPWTASGHVDLYASGPAATVGGSGAPALYNGVGPNFLTTPPPFPGSIVGLEEVNTLQSSISQKISALIPGETYSLTFDWAAAQQVGTPSSTVQALMATLGGSSVTTSPVSLAPADFSGWMLQTAYFVATSPVETLTLQTVDNGNLPSTLVGNVSLLEVPEPATIFAGALMVLPVGMTVLRRWCKGKQTPV